MVIGDQTTITGSFTLATRSHGRQESERAVPAVGTEDSADTGRTWQPNHRHRHRADCGGHARHLEESCDWWPAPLPRSIGTRNLAAISAGSPVV